MKMNFSKSFQRGFTLIELLIVIAVLGTLAVVVLIALNPVQQLARTRDAGRSSSVQQLGRSMEARGTVLGGIYPLLAACPVDTWITDCLVAAGEIQTVPGNLPASYSAGGVTNSCADAQGFCYSVDLTGNEFTIYTSAEAQSNTAQCAAVDQTWFVYASAAGRGGLYCGAAPTVTAFNLTNFTQ